MATLIDVVGCKTTVPVSNAPEGSNLLISKPLCHKVDFRGRKCVALDYAMVPNLLDESSHAILDGNLKVWRENTSILGMPSSYGSSSIEVTSDPVVSNLDDAKVGFHA